MNQEWIPVSERLPEIGEDGWPHETKRSHSDWSSSPTHALMLALLGLYAEEAT